MQVNPQQLLDDGFIILRQVVPPEQLDSLRASYETVVERQHRHLGRRAGLGRAGGNGL